MSEESGKALFDEIKHKKPKRLGASIGMEGENFIVALDEEKVYSLTAGAYYVWSICDGQRTLEELVKNLSEELSTNPETAMTEEELKEPITVIITQLENAGLLVLQD